MADYICLMNETKYQLLKVIRKIRLFQGLELQDIQMLLPVCRLVTLEPFEKLYESGSVSREMLLLLKGKLQVVADTGELLAVVGPGSSVGEMGFFTGEKRSANIVVVEQSTGFRIDKQSFTKILDSNAEMKSVILGNVVAVLSERLVQANQANLERNETIARMNEQLVRHTGMNSGDLEKRGM